jgi:phosphoribosylglycinamide formyltransferase 1
MSVPVAVLISGSGTNLQALIDGCEGNSIAHIAVVISNRRDAYGLERAKSKGIPTYWVSHRNRTRDSFEKELLTIVQNHQVEWVCLAGFMRVLTDVFLSQYKNRVLNIHPSLLPAFPGLNAQQQALEYGVKQTGATVHFVDSGMDTGPIVLQESVSIMDSDDLDRLKEKVLQIEHQLFPKALQLAALGNLQVSGRRVTILD